MDTPVLTPILDQFSQAIADLHIIHDADQQIIAAQKAEIESLTRQLADLRRGKGVMVIISGQSFGLEGDGPSPFDPASLMQPDVRDEVSMKLAAFSVEHQSNGHQRSGVEDSFVL